MEGDGVVSPVITQFLTCKWIGANVFGFIEFEDRHQFDAIDTELFQVRNFFAYTRKGTGVNDSRRGALGEASDMHFVDDKIFDGKF